jgi:SAM-dependent methyltransferase
MQSGRVGLVIPPELRRNRESDANAALDAAVWLIAHMSSHVGVTDLGAFDVLDVGCGFRFTQAFVDRGVPIGHYVGLDTADDVIDFLRTHVDDSRLEYVHLNAHNALYNPTGVPLSDLAIPELEGRTFDLICLFSVFTHLAPHDYVAMLTLLRRYARPDARLFYTLFIDELTEGGFGYMDRVNRAIEQRPQDAAVAAAVSRGVSGQKPGFADLDPERPLHIAMYSRPYALELIDGTGWRVLEVAPPSRHLQHHIVCAVE